MKKIIVALVSGLVAFNVIAETYDLAVGDGSGFSATLSSPRALVVEQTLDFAVQNVTTGDVVQLIDIPANTYVLAVQAEVVSAATENTNTTQTITVGDSDADGWITSLSTIAVGDSSSAPTLTATSTSTSFPVSVTAAWSPAYGNGKYYTSADTLDVTAAGVIVDGKVRVRMAVLDFGL